MKSLQCLSPMPMKDSKLSGPMKGKKSLHPQQPSSKAKRPCIRKLMLKERAENWPRNSSKGDVIDVEKYEVKNPLAPPPKWIPELDLLMLDRYILMNPSMWLTLTLHKH